VEGYKVKVTQEPDCYLFPEVYLKKKELVGRNSSPKPTRDSGDSQTYGRRENSTPNWGADVLPVKQFMPLYFFSLPEIQCVIN